MRWVPAGVLAMVLGAIALSADETAPAGAPSAWRNRGANFATDGKSDVRLVKMFIGPPQELLDDPDEYDTGMRITLRAVRNDADLLALDFEASKILSFTDDRGSDLSGARHKRMEPDDEGVEKEVEEWEPAAVEECEEVDEHQVRFVLFTPQPPAEGATRLKLKMTLRLLCGFDVRETEKVALKLEEDAQAQAGLFPVRVTDYRENDDGTPVDFGKGEVKIGDKPPAALVDLEFTERKRRWVKTAKFFDANGEIPSVMVVIHSEEKGDGIVSTNAVGLARKARDVTIALTYYDRVADVDVPITVDTGLGF